MSGVWPPQFEAPDDPRFGPPSRWRRGDPIEPRALTLSDVLERALRLYRLHWKALMGFVGILVVPVQFLDAYLNRNFQHDLFIGTQTAQADNGNAALIALVISAITLFVVQPLVNGGLARAVASVHLGRTPSAGEILDGALPLLGPVILVMILYALAVIGGLLLFVVPGVFFAIKFLFAVPAVVLEKERGSEAMRRSWRLTDGNFWRVFGIVLLTAILVAITSAIITVPTVLATLNTGSSGWFIRAVGGSVAAVLTTPFSQLVTLLLYLDLRVRKEGLTLERLQWEVGSTPSFGT
jgi:Membrane domain of glycerophosphoryl diester phosphodiesterase